MGENKMVLTCLNNACFIYIISFEAPAKKYVFLCTGKGVSFSNRPADWRLTSDSFTIDL